MTKNPLVSIMIPTYNRPVLFERTLKSALTQTYDNIEIIVNDNSTDDRTEELIQKYLTDKRLQYYRNKEAKSKEANFMPFEHQAKGEYLQWCMDDDILYPQKIAYMAAVLKDNPTITLVTSRRETIDENDNPIMQERKNLVGIQDEYGVFTGEEIGKAILKNMLNFIGEPSAVLFRRDDLTHHYWHAESKGMYALSDIAMWLELMEKGNCLIFRDSLSAYRRHSQQEGQQPDSIIISRLEWMQLVEEYYSRRIFIKTEAECRECLSTLYMEYENPVFGMKSFHDAKNYEEYVFAMETIGELLRKK